MNLFVCSSFVRRINCQLVSHTSNLFYAEISNDISRRLESQARWNGVDLNIELQEKDAAVEKEDEELVDEGSDYEEEDSKFKSSLSLPIQTSGNDIILSMKDENYKKIMFSFFRQLKVHAVKERDRDEERRVRNEAYDFLNGLGGRMLKYRNRMKPEDGLVDVDEKTVRASKYHLLSKSHFVFLMHLLV